MTSQLEVFHLLSCLGLLESVHACQWCMGFSTERYNCMMPTELLQVLWFANSVVQNTVMYLRRQGAIDHRCASTGIRAIAGCCLDCCVPPVCMAGGQRLMTAATVLAMGAACCCLAPKRAA